MSLHTRTVGAGPDLVLVHGWGMNAAVWAPLVEALASDYRLTLVDLPGHGESPYDAGRSALSHWAADVLEVAPRGASWIAWSLGAQVALRAALDAPERVNALMLVAGTPKFVHGDGWPQAMAAESFRQFAASLAADHQATLERFLALQVRGAEQAASTLRQLRFEVRARPLPADAALENGLELLLSTDLRAEVGMLKRPTLWLLGERDTLVPAGVGAALQHLGSDAEVQVIPGAGHAPFLSHPERTLAAFRRFLVQVGVHV